MQSRPQISVIIPCYQKADSLSRCLDSLLCQTVERLEIICINDGSTDNTKSILNSYAQQHTNVLVIHQENQGVARTRNRGIDLASGAFIGFLDADDTYASEGTLEYLYNAALENSVQIAGGAMSHMVDGVLDPPSLYTEREYHFDRDGIILYKDYQYDYGFTRFIYARELFEDSSVRFPELRSFEDPVFFVKLMAKAERFYATQQPSYIYYTPSEGRSYNKKSIIDTLQGLRMNLEFSQKERLERLHATSLARLYFFELYNPMYAYIKAGDPEVLRHFLILIKSIDKELLNHKNCQEIRKTFKPHAVLIRSTFFRCVLRLLTPNKHRKSNYKQLLLILIYCFSKKWIGLRPNTTPK